MDLYDLQDLDSITLMDLCDLRDLDHISLQLWDLDVSYLFVGGICIFHHVFHTFAWVES